MRTLYFLLAITFLLRTSTQAQTATAVSAVVVRHSSSQPFVKGELIVKYKRSSGVQSKARSAVQLGAQRKRLLSARMEHLALPENITVESAMAQLQADPEVESVQPNYVYHAFRAPSDPQANMSWAIQNSAQNLSLGQYTTNNPGTSGDDLNLEKAWDVATDCSSVLIAIIDSGVTYDHVDLQANLWDGGTTYPHHGYNFVENNTDTRDLNGHGTHVAGIIGATGNNGVGTAGVCWTAKIMALRALDAAASGTTVSLTSALNFAAAKHVQVINMSLGASGDDPAIHAALQTLNDQGTVIVVAAGNDGADVDANPVYPCSYDLPNLLCVAALDQSFALADFSNFGKKSVNTAAPGVNILSTFAGTETSTSLSLSATGGWITSGTGWGYESPLLSSGTTQEAVPMLVNPANWDGHAQTYANNEDARIYKNLNLAGMSSAHVDVYGFYDLKGTDSGNFAFSSSGGDPFGASGTVLDQATGSSGNSGFNTSYDLGSCLSSACTFGFQLKSDASGVGFGLGIYDVSLTTLSLNTTSYKYLDGTSMATPFVTGLAALVLAHNPSYTAQDVVTSIKNGGRTVSSLADKTSTGKAADAYGALTYIAAPAGVKVTVE